MPGTKPRPVVLAPGLNSCCVHLVMGIHRPTSIGEVIQCRRCTSRLRVAPDGCWRWLKPAPHTFLGTPHDDFCKWSGCNAPNYDEIHELTDSQLDDLVVDMARGRFGSSQIVADIVRHAARLTRSQERDEWRRSIHSRMSMSRRESKILYDD